MPRYFLELAYKGTAYSGFQVQRNTGHTIQAEVEKAIHTLQRAAVTLTGSSRTDAGVHALQNFFHFDFEDTLHPQFLYKLNAILPKDIVLKNCRQVDGAAHSRFDAVSRQYAYYIYRGKDPFLEDRAFYFPYKLDIDLLNEAARVLMKYQDFTSFSKRNTQVKSFQCRIMKSAWTVEEDCLVYRVKGDRFLRGMVRALTATMLKVARGKINMEDFRKLIEARDCTLASFAVPAHGLFLEKVNFSQNDLTS